MCSELREGTSDPRKGKKSGQGGTTCLDVCSRRGACSCSDWPLAGEPTPASHSARGSAAHPDFKDADSTTMHLNLDAHDRVSLQRHALGFLTPDWRLVWK